MRIVSIAEAKAKLSAYIKASKEGPIVMTRNGSPVAVILSVEDPDELERLLLAHSPRFQSLLKTARDQLKSSTGIRHDDFWNEPEATR